MLISTVCVRHGSDRTSSTFLFFFLLGDVKKNVQPWVGKTSGMPLNLLSWQTPNRHNNHRDDGAMKIQLRRLQSPSRVQRRQRQHALCCEVRAEGADAAEVGAVSLCWACGAINSPGTCSSSPNSGQRHCWQEPLTRAGVCDSIYVTLERGFVGLINAWQPTREDELGSAERLLTDWRNRVCCMPPSAWASHCSTHRYGLHSKSYSSHGIFSLMYLCIC